MAKRKSKSPNGRPPRMCAKCKLPYWRSNRFRLWNVQNPGHRDGWQKEEGAICTRCMNAAQATRIIGITKIAVIVETPVPKRAL